MKSAGGSIGSKLAHASVKCGFVGPESSSHGLMGEMQNS